MDINAGQTAIVAKKWAVEGHSSHSQTSSGQFVAATLDYSQVDVGLIEDITLMQSLRQ